jgi:hypothetical protein
MNISNALRKIADNIDKNEPVLKNLSAVYRQGSFNESANKEVEDLIYSLIPKVLFSEKTFIYAGVEKDKCSEGDIKNIAIGTVCYTPDPTNSSGNYVITRQWGDSSVHRDLMKRGWIYLDKAQAEKRGRAMSKVVKA